MAVAGQHEAAPQDLGASGIRAGLLHTIDGDGLDLPALDRAAHRNARSDFEKVLIDAIHRRRQVRLGDVDHGLLTLVLAVGLDDQASVGISRSEIELRFLIWVADADPLHHRNRQALVVLLVGLFEVDGREREAALAHERREHLDGQHVVGDLPSWAVRHAGGEVPPRQGWVAKGT